MRGARTVIGPRRRGPVTAGEDAPGRLSRANIAALVAFFLALVLVVLGSVVPLPYAVLSPGPTMNVLGDAPNSSTPLIDIDGARTYPTDGALRFTTVVISGGPGHRVHLWAVLDGWLDPTKEVVPVGAVFPPDASSKQVEQVNALEMKGSQQEATAVALRAVGKQVPTHIVVAKVLDSSKATGLLRAGDRIDSVGGTRVDSLDAVRTALQQVDPGKPIEVKVTRADKPVTMQVPTIEGPQGRTALGILLGIDHDFPIDVTIRAGDVGGPSAGLMFSLGIYDKLTPGALTGNHSIAGTGTIDDDGKVGPIGGIRQKLDGAKDDGADYFLAPDRDCDEAVGAIPDGLRVVRVSTFTEAVTAVEAIAKADVASLPHC
ncbi:MAG: PDZ domain-containing protein [Micrococcales bacterium]|nr:PDZ domain-containing protein [Micrococcales bacterium]